MELHPIIDDTTSELCKGICYVVSGHAKQPSFRVGHSCTQLASVNAEPGKVYVIAGANPSELFNDVHTLDPKSLQWERVVSSNEDTFLARYEHAAFSPACDPCKIYVFGGANKEGNFNDVQRFDTTTSKWETVKVSGTAPHARTCRSTANIGNKLYIYSGGMSGPDPISDTQVHSFDAETCSWTGLTLTGEPPEPRHGHIMCASGNRVFIHGGMGGVTFYNDLHVLDLDLLAWTKVKAGKHQPGPRAGHQAAVYGKKIYVFGGMCCSCQALDDLYILDTDVMQWTKVELNGPPPAPRLDFTMAIVMLKLGETPSVPSLDVHTDNAQAVSSSFQELNLEEGQAFTAELPLKSEMVPSNTTALEIATKLPSTNTEAAVVSPSPVSGHGTSVHVCMIFGGMDAEGEIFDDCLVMML
ncbi:PREDICTED: rab9 effector protein with kelch motifs-like [Priapulus caudatus]|uniref:Rab9 effector protein with kelch motifs n=1 Tax=Priapulus caudatus TaxID=37621 RepID=A0ABM1E7X9_PRICU|nr:PREDICTED: rab9 effector protein with kelch motifs-like [Priapulus caudatus]